MIDNMVEAAVRAGIIKDYKLSRLALGAVLLSSRKERIRVAKQLDEWEAENAEKRDGDVS